MDLLGTNDGMYRSSSSLFSSKTEREPLPSLAQGDLISFSPEEESRKGSSKEKASESIKANPDEAVESWLPLRLESSKAEMPCSQGTQIRSNSKIDRGFSPFPDVYGERNRGTQDITHPKFTDRQFSRTVGQDSNVIGPYSCDNIERDIQARKKPEHISRFEYRDNTDRARLATQTEPMNMGATYTVYPDIERSHTYRSNAADKYEIPPYIGRDARGYPRGPPSGSDPSIRLHHIEEQSPVGLNRTVGDSSEMLMEDPLLRNLYVNQRQRPYYERQGIGQDKYRSYHETFGLDGKPTQRNTYIGVPNYSAMPPQQGAGLYCTNGPEWGSRGAGYFERQSIRKQKEPDKYDGEKVEWQDFYVHFETVATWNGWTETEKGLQLATCLRGKAQKVLSELKASQKADYAFLVSVLAKRFNPPHRENAFRAVLRQRRRLPKESLMDFGCDVSRLAQKAYPEFPYEALDQVSREQFVRGLTDIEMKRHVDLRNPSSLEEAISLATQFESFEQGEGHIPGIGRGESRPAKNRTAPVQAEDQKGTVSKGELASLQKQIELLLTRESKAEQDSKAIADLQGKLSKLSDQVESLTKLGVSKSQTNWINRSEWLHRSKNSNNMGRFPKGNCFECGQPGHYKNSCPKSKKTEVTSSKERQESSRPVAQRVTNLKGGWLVPGTVQGVEVEFLVDSGSDVTLVDSRFYDSIPAYARPHLDPTGCCLTTASGSPMAPVGEAHLKLGLGAQNWSYPFIVTELGSTKAIIGNDFLREKECFLDMRLGILGIGNEKLLLQTERTASCCRVRLAGPVEVPPGHEVRFPGIIDKPCEGCVVTPQGLVQPVTSLVEDTGLLMGTSLVDTTKTLVPITLMNIGEKTKRLPQGLTVGMMEPVEESCVGGESGTCPEADVIEPSAESTEHLSEMLRCMGNGLDVEQIKRVKNTVFLYRDVFASPSGELGHTAIVQHTIDTGGSHPIKQSPRRLPQVQRDIADKEVEKMLEKGFIEPSDSPWASPIVLVTKKDGSTRFCIDYRRLNDVTRKDSFPLPRIDETIESLTGAQWFSTLDLASGYWQVSVSANDRAKTAFATRKGLFQWKVMPFGLANAPATFSRLMEMVLRGLNWERCLVYLDDIIVFGKSFDEALKNLTLVFERLRQAGLRLKPSKCSLFQSSVKFLGHMVSSEGVSCDPDKISCVRDWETPRCVTEVRSFVGFASYYRRFIPDFAKIASPLTKLTEKNSRFNWTEECAEQGTTLSASKHLSVRATKVQV